MEISRAGGAAFFSLKQALKQPENIVSVLTGKDADQKQPLSAPSGNAALQKEVAVQTGKGAIINILA